MADKVRNNKPALKSLPKSAFQEAVENTEEVKNGFRIGLHAIKNADRCKINTADSMKLQGSLDIDSQVKALYPRDPRWDYAISYDDKMYYFEIHPAETSQVSKVIDKVKWLRNWLKTKAPEIDRLSKTEMPYIWVQSGRHAILPRSKEKMKLSAAGIITARDLTLK